MGGLFGQEYGSAFYCSKYFYILILGLGLSPVIVKKELAELEWLATLLAVAITIFVLLSLNLLLFDSRYTPPPGSQVSIVWPQTGWSTISALCTIMVAYSYQQNVFPIYESLREQSTSLFVKSQIIGLGFTCLVYLLVGVIGVYLFGNTVQSSVLINFGDIRTPEGKPFFESQVIQVAFIIVLLCHIPFIFFAGKEAVCIIVDEFDRKSISKVLELKANEIREVQSDSSSNALSAFLPEIDLSKSTRKSLMLSVVST